MSIKVANAELIDQFGQYFLEKRNEFPDKTPSFRTPPHFGLADQWMENLVRWLLGIPRETLSPELKKRYQAQHYSIVLEMAKKIIEKRTYYFFLDFLRALEKRFNLPFPLYVGELKKLSPTLSSFLLTEILLLWALMEKEGRFLVCVREGHQRKYFPLPDDPEKRKRAILEIGQHILAILTFITPEHLDLIPDKFGPIHGVDAPISVELAVQAIGEILADTQARRRYIVNPEGMPVEFEKAGDLERMFIKVIDGVVIAKVETRPEGGGTLAFIDLETAQGVDFALFQSKPPFGLESPSATALAVAYWALVTAKVRPGQRRRVDVSKIGRRIEKPELPREQKPYIRIYIPRTITVGGKVKEVSPQLAVSPGRHKSPIPHLRHLKIGQISAEQRRRIEALEREKRVEILKWVPPGCTFVLPSGEITSVVYVKSRVRADLPMVFGRN